ncbi:MAG: ribosome biogenesis/translation initiation ATPase RLI [Candidatus Altiarchaeota archaeon]|nr:ribosome biogenesis/translation initiation ATPase RLI [Candidatus Altiarchaeota archaeon]
MRIAVIDRERCKVKTCGLLCQRSCPMVKTGRETIIVDEESGKPVIVEDMCSGCGICVRRCPFEAIQIINLPEEVGEPIHQYGLNGFRLYNLPTPKEGVVGVVGANGIGKTTMMKILSGELKPNLGREDADWGEVVERFRGKEIQNYLEKLSRKDIKAVYKPQHVDKIPDYVKGKVREILEKADETGRLSGIVEKLDLGNALDADVKELSGGELQRVALTAALVKDADVYLIDEPSSYLDVRERLNMARVVREISEVTKKYVFVIEHDLIVLDYLSDYIHVIYGTSGAYGIISNVKGTRVGINEYLGGYLKSENVRFREGIRFEAKPPSGGGKEKEKIAYPALVKDYERFMLEVDAGEINKEEVLGILGRNATGKTTYVKMLAGVIEPDNEKLELDLKVSYKPQYIKPEGRPVASLKLKAELMERFRIKHLLDRNMEDLSGGELQKVAIADCLTKDADFYLLDEPSAYLDVEERLRLGKHVKRFIEENKKTILLVDHDILLVDYLSDRLMIFTGEGGRNGHAASPVESRKGMNAFLKEMNLTFRRDEETKRPRANKEGSVKDREQKSSGEYYYVK